MQNWIFLGLVTARHHPDLPGPRSRKKSVIVILRTRIAGDNGCGLVELMGIMHGDYTRIKPASRNIQMPLHTLYVTAGTRPDPDFIVDILRKIG
jgi:hypothetical protein